MLTTPDQNEIIQTLNTMNLVPLENLSSDEFGLCLVVVQRQERAFSHQNFGQGNRLQSTNRAKTLQRLQRARGAHCEWLAYEEAEILYGDLNFFIFHFTGSAV